MEAALVSAATGALKPVLEKLAALLGEKYTRFKKVHDEIKSLTDELTAMHAFLLKMSEEENPDVQDKAWMKEVRELSYDMEDTVDDFMQSVDQQDTKPEGFMDKLRYSLGKMQARHRIGNEIQQLKKQITEVGQRSARYKTNEAFSKTINATIDHRALAIFENASNLVGIDEPKNEIIKLLTEGRERKFKLVSIVGPGGMGKTTLANQVYQELTWRFDCQAFLSASRNPDMMRLLRTILSEVSGKPYSNTEAGSIQQVIKQINSFLKSKRYLIVIDDIWELQTWEALKCAFPKNKCGSKIITTTRMNDVAYSCRSLSSSGGYIHKIRPLSMAQSRKLFHKRLFSCEEDCPSHLKEVSDQILGKCAGLPLAIIAISGLLFIKGSIKDQWDQVKDSIGRALERNPTVERMIEILSLSYFDLPPHLKTCLLYLSIFPEDSVIEKQDLIRRWIAEGFIHKEERYTTYELGERCFNELVNRSLIQPEEPNVYDKVESCRVHDTILDFIISKSTEENFVTLFGVPNVNIGAKRKVRRLALQFGKQGNSVLPRNWEFSHVRSVSVFGSSENSPSLRDEYRHLRFMDFEDRSQMTNYHLANIGKLFQLRYLNLRKTKVSQLPEEIGYLRCLEMLDLRDTIVRELPSSIVNLEKLVDLFVECVVKFPEGIGKMQALEVLEKVGVLGQSFNFLEELGLLKNLRKLHLDFEVGFATGAGDTTKEVREKCMKAIVPSLHKLGTQNLLSLTITNDRSFLLEQWSPVPLRIQKLRTYLSVIPQVPSWVGSVINLQHVRLEVNGVRHEDICILGSLPTLLILKLVEDKYYLRWPVHPSATVMPTHKINISGEVGFRCLRKLCYIISFGALDLKFLAGSMPKLQKLDIKFDADAAVKTHGIDDAFDFGIENLPRITNVECGVSGLSCYDNVKYAQAALTRATNKHPTPPSLLFTRGY